MQLPRMKSTLFWSCRRLFRVFPIKRLSIPRLELCGAEVLARLLQHVKEGLQIPLSDDMLRPTVLSWSTGNKPGRFVGSVSSIVDQIHPDGAMLLAP